MCHGELVCAGEEERFSRAEHDAHLPWRDLRFCLAQGGITLPQVDCVAYFESFEKKLARQLWRALRPGASGAQTVATSAPAEYVLSAKACGAEHLYCRGFFPSLQPFNL